MQAKKIIPDHTSYINSPHNKDISIYPKTNCKQILSRSIQDIIPPCTFSECTRRQHNLSCITSSLLLPCFLVKQQVWGWQLQSLTELPYLFFIARVQKFPICHMYLMSASPCSRLDSFVAAGSQASHPPAFPSTVLGMSTRLSLANILSFLRIVKSGK